MRTYITLLEFRPEPGQPTVNTTGGRNGAYIPAFSFWGKVEHKKAWETENAQRLQAYDNVYIVARYDPRIETNTILSFNGKTYKVRGVTNVEERNHIMEIDASEGVGD